MTKSWWNTEDCTILWLLGYKDFKRIINKVKRRMKSGKIDVQRRLSTGLRCYGSSMLTWDRKNRSHGRVEFWTFVWEVLEPSGWLVCKKKGLGVHRGARLKGTSAKHSVRSLPTRPLRSWGSGDDGLELTVFSCALDSWKYRWSFELMLYFGSQPKRVGVLHT